MPQVRIGDKVIEIDDRGVAKCTSKSIDRGNGRVDVEIHIPVLKVVQKQPNKEKGV